MDQETRPYPTEDTQLPGRTRPATGVVTPTAPRRLRVPAPGPTPTATLPRRTGVRPGSPDTPTPTLPPVAAPASNLPVAVLIGGIMVGAIMALLTIPAWVPPLAVSLAGAEPKAAWYLSRAAAFVAFGLIWISMASGLLITNKMARVWPGAFTAFDLHQYTSLLGLGFAAFHAIILLLDRYIAYNLLQIIIPFGSSDYRPIWVGLGQIAFYLSILVTFTFYIRKQIGNHLWHLIHLLSYGLFALVLVHGVFSGTDSANLWVTAYYWIGGLSLSFLTIYRMLIKRTPAPAI